MAYLSLPKAVASNRRTKTRLQSLISTESFRDKSDRTLTFGQTGSISEDKVEYMHVYFRDKAIHVFSYFIGEDDRWLYSKKFQFSQVAATKLVPASGALWSATDEEFAHLMEVAGSPLFFVPMKIWGKPVELIEAKYFGHVPTLTCKPHPESLDF